MRKTYLSCLVSLLVIGLTQAQDRTLNRRDSLEIELLRTTQTYAQLSRLLNVLPPLSDYLSLLPGVLPVDMPVGDFRITSAFGLRRHPIFNQSRFHGGIDIKAPTGTVVKATASGFVCETGIDAVLGAFVRVRHTFGLWPPVGVLRQARPMH